MAARVSAAVQGTEARQSTADADGGDQLDEHPGAGEQGGPARGRPLTGGDPVDDVRGAPLVFFERPGGDEFPVPGDEFDGPFGEFGPVRGACPGGIAGARTTSHGRKAPPASSPAASAPAAGIDAVAVTATAAAPTSTATPAGSTTAGRRPAERPHRTRAG